MTKTTACVGEHCLRLRLEIFLEKRILCTMVVGVKKGPHIKRSAFMCAEPVIFLNAFKWKRSNLFLL